MKRCYLLGYPVKHSMSAIMHNAAFREHGLDYTYILRDVPPESLEEAVDTLRKQCVIGANVTIPHKSTIIEFLDEVTPEAGAIGAVNTVVKHCGVLRGDNTDARGGIKALEEVYGELEKAVVLVLGAGGAARAIVYKLAPVVAELTVLNRTAGKAMELAEHVKEITGARVKGGGVRELEEAVRCSDILINATPVGMKPGVQCSPVPREFLHGGLLVYDLVYNPLETRLLREAKNCDARTLSGVKMLAYQGALAYEMWTGLDPPLELMVKVVQNALGGEPPRT